jgi:hypothetical protein
MAAAAVGTCKEVVALDESPHGVGDRHACTHIDEQRRV